MMLQLLNHRSFRRNLTNYPAFKRALFFAAYSALCLPSSISAQSFAYTNLSNNAQPRPATDGTNVVTTDTFGDIIVYPFVGGTSTTLVPLGTALPNGLGTATSFTVFGAPEVINGLVYFEAQSASGSGYYSVPVTGGPIHVIVDSTSKDSSGRSINAAALPLELAPTVYFNSVPLSIPGIKSNLFVSPSGNATFTANLTSTTAPQGDLAILKLSTSGVLSSVIDTNTLSGCTRISNFATDGNILAVWALSTTNELLLLESNGPALSCSNVLVDLGVPGTVATGILPGQPSSGSIMEEYISPSTVIDSGYIYFSATMTLTDATINSGTYGGNVGYYGGIFRIRPGGSLEKIIATDSSQLATLSPFFGPALTSPLLICGSFAVRGNDLVFATGWLDLESWAGSVYPLGVFFFDKGAGTLRAVYAQGVAFSPTVFSSAYSGVTPTEAALSADGKFAFEVGVEVFPLSSFIFPSLYTVNLPAAGTTTTLTGVPNPATYGQPATLTATVTPSGSTAPTGQVTFFDSVNAIGTGALNSAGVATLAVTLWGGQRELTATYDGDSTYSASTFNGVVLLEVNPAAPVLNLSSSASGATPATTVTLTATAVGVTGAAVPTGSVTFLNGMASLGTSTLNSTGVASLAVQNLPIGTDLITATYAGDTNYSTVGSATTTINVAATSTFNLSSSSTSLTIAQGQTGTATISLAPVGGFSAPVQFSCSGLPQYATCSFAPPSITAGASVAKTTLTIATNMQTGELVWPSGLSYAAVLLLGLGTIRRARNGIRRMSVPLFMILMAVVGPAVGCGGSSGMSHVTPAGVSTVVVSASSGTTVQTVSLTVTIAQN
jgi:hypothetical protein